MARGVGSNGSALATSIPARRVDPFCQEFRDVSYLYLASLGIGPAPQLQDAPLVVRHHFQCAGVRDVVELAGHQALADLRVLEGKATAESATEACLTQVPHVVTQHV